MDLSNLTLDVMVVLMLVLVAEAANGWTDAPCATSSAVASGVLSSKTALWLTVIGNFAGLLIALAVGAKVATTIGTGIVQQTLISVHSIGVAMLATIMWSTVAAIIGLPISKTHSLLAALAGIGFAKGGIAALAPASGNWTDSGWVSVGIGVFCAIAIGSALAWFLGSLIKTMRLDTRLPLSFWWKLQIVTVIIVASGHGFNDGLKYVGVFTMVLEKAKVIPHFQVFPSVIVLCAVVMGVGTLLGGWKIHRRLDTMVNGPAPAAQKKSYEPYMGVSSEVVGGGLIWQTGFLGIPTSTNHSVVSAMAGAKSASSFSELETGEKKARVHISSLIKIIWGWMITYLFCGGAAWLLATWSP